MKLKSVFEFLKVILSALAIAVCVWMFFDSSQILIFNIATEALFYFSAAYVVFLLASNFRQKGKSFSSIGLIVFIWFAFLKFVNPIQLFVSQGNIAQLDFLNLFIVITVIFLFIYIYSARTEVQFIAKIKIHPLLIISLTFMGVIFLGTILLMLPISRVPGQPPIALIDALFTSTSAVCVTGLTTLDTGSYFSRFGQVIILFLVQVGGLGLMTFVGLAYLVIGEKMSLHGKLTTQNAVNESNAANVGKFLVAILVTTFSIEFIGAIFLFISMQSRLPFGDAVYYSIFHAVSAFCNAGFGLFSHNLMSFQKDYIVLITIMMLITFGGIGFSVMYNLYLMFLGRVKKMTLHTKMALILSSILLLGGALGFYIFEKDTILKNMTPDIQIINSFFTSVTARTAGFNAVDYGLAKDSSLLFIIILMFIGASPGSTGGGVKTTTMMVIFFTLLSVFKNSPDTIGFKRTIPLDTIKKSFLLFFVAISWVLIITMVMYSLETQSMMRIMFEVTSAFGTVGLSTGITPKLTPLSKFLLCLTMFLGRVGPITLIMILGGDGKNRLSTYPNEDVLIG